MGSLTWGPVRSPGLCLSSLGPGVTITEFLCRDPTLILENIHFPWGVYGCGSIYLKKWFLHMMHLLPRANWPRSTGDKLYEFTWSICAWSVLILYSHLLISQSILYVLLVDMMYPTTALLTDLLEGAHFPACNVTKVVPMISWTGKPRRVISFLLLLLIHHFFFCARRKTSR